VLSCVVLCCGCALVCLFVFGVAFGVFGCAELSVSFLFHSLSALGICLSVLSLSVTAPTVLSFLLYGFSVISFSYLLSFAFDEPGGAQNILLLIYFATGLVLLIVSVVLNAFDSTKEINGKLVYDD